MIARYASAISSGAAITFGLLIVMQLLIHLQPGAKTELVPSIPVNWIKQQTRDTPVVPRDKPITRDQLTNSEQQPARLPYNGELKQIGVYSGGPVAPTLTAIPTIGAYTDGPLVALVRVAPTYPIRATTAGIEGYVVVQFDVLANGHVANIAIIESTHSVFNNAAIKAAQRFKFKPQVIEGVALASYGIRNRFRFALDDE